jgi:hypothetical protein
MATAFLHIGNVISRTTAEITVMKLVALVTVQIVGFSAQMAIVFSHILLATGTMIVAITAMNYGVLTVTVHTVGFSVAMDVASTVGKSAIFTMTAVITVMKLAAPVTVQMVTFFATTVSAYILPCIVIFIMTAEITAMKMAAYNVATIGIPMFGINAKI